MEYLDKNKCRIYDNKKNIIIKFIDEDIILDKEELDAIYDFWNQMKKENPNLFNGITYSISDIQVEEDAILLYVKRSNYAHYLYTIHHIKNDITVCKNMAVGALLLTRDGKYVLGKMSDKTSFPGIVQCIGGGIGSEDVKEGVINPVSTLKREFLEEIGWQLNEDEITNHNYIYVREKMSTFGICYLVKTLQSYEEIYRDFTEYKKSEQYDDELEDIVCINELDDLAGLELVDYLPEIFASVYNHKELPTFES